MSPTFKSLWTKGSGYWNMVTGPPKDEPRPYIPDLIPLSPDQLENLPIAKAFRILLSGLALAKGFPLVRDLRYGLLVKVGWAVGVTSSNPTGYTWRVALGQVLWTGARQGNCSGLLGYNQPTNCKILHQIPCKVGWVTACPCSN